MTKAKIMATAAKLGLVVEDDGETIMVSSKAPRHDGTGCHELCTEVDRYESKAEAWADVMEDLLSDWVDCEIQNCEWCNA